MTGAEGWRKGRMEGSEARDDMMAGMEGRKEGIEGRGMPGGGKGLEKDVV